MESTNKLEEFTEMVCLESDLQDGEMNEVVMDHHKILLVRNNGEFTAVGGLCTHYGAPLVKGALVGDRVRCPFHGACFNTKTGDIEEFPGLDCLPKYKVKVEDGKVYVTAAKKMKNKRVKEMSGRVPEVRHTVVLIGGGPASLQCAETLRQNSYGGRIIIVSKDEQLPLDKTKLSKAMNIEIEKILLRQSDFLQQYEIEVWTKMEVMFVDTSAKTVTFKDGTNQQYDQLLISTGSRARPLQCPGAEMENVKLLQNYKDATEIHQISSGKRAVIVGTSFIGMEVAAYLSDKASSVTVIGSSKFPFQSSLGPDIGKMTMQMLEERNVKFYMCNGVAEIQGKNGMVKEVLLTNGEVLPADIVIVGIGVLPNSDFLKTTSVEINSRNAVVVDELMRTNVPDVFGAGDVVSFPLALVGNKRVNIGHWQLAQAHGRIAGLSMLNRQVEINTVPYFWTVLLGKSIRFTGYGEGYTDIVFKGSLEERTFLAFYIKDEEVVAAASMNFDPAVARLAEMLLIGKKITKAQAQSDDLSWLRFP
ncbi:apoptosis inducing factor mitochondria associated 4 [Triplophysa dalaica]|uniref:apoptosis inducing factor mitochondria associated 4 n=1 Tax=Triplophysa dalaica TaxID=1582913 RepID=UPI0024DF384B|nr:apoptosis inducing factor mitochondria associated 4 [Triplophysa dalaica]XP_056612917.1 apoptosis inducing factor mitochondria associated 4 [Triplophysa dalaica]